MTDVDRTKYTRATLALSRGDRHEADQLVPALYDELRRMAAGFLHHERAGHSLNPTALVHEAYMRLVDQSGMHWENRAHFLAWASGVMRQVLVSHARARGAQKRGGGRARVPLDMVLISFEERAFDLIALDEALKELADADERKSRIVELRFFGGMTIAEVEKVLDLSHATIEREWRFARAWLQQRVTGDREPEA